MSKKKIEMAVPRTSSIDLVVPVLDTGFPELRRIDLVLTARQSKAMRMVFDGLQANGEQIRLVGKREMRLPGDAVRWLLDQIADEVGLP